MTRGALIVPGLLLALAACVPNSIQPQRTDPAAFAAWADDNGPYQIGVGDEVEIKLPYHAAFNDRVTVGPDGHFTLPLVGDTAAEGRTTVDLARELDLRYGNEFRDPRVQVAIRAYASERVFVGGEVNNAGVYNVPGRVGVLEVLTMANGLMDTAQSHKIVLIRRSPSGRPMMKVIDLSGFVAGASEDVRIHPFDIIFVPKTQIAEVDQFVDQFITRVVPFQRNFNYTLGRQSLD